MLNYCTDLISIPYSISSSTSHNMQSVAKEKKRPLKYKTHSSEINQSKTLDVEENLKKQTKATLSAWRASSLSPFIHDLY